MFNFVLHESATPALCHFLCVTVLHEVTAKLSSETLKCRSDWIWFLALEIWTALVACLLGVL